MIVSEKNLLDIQTNKTPYRHGEPEELKALDATIQEIENTIQRDDAAIQRHENTVERAALDAVLDRDDACAFEQLTKLSVDQLQDLSHACRILDRITQATMYRRRRRTGTVTGTVKMERYANA